MPVEYNKNTATVDEIAARSLSIIMSFRFQRSTNAPAIGLINMVGAKAKNPTRARAVAVPVTSYAQKARAKPAIAVPNSETS